VNGEAMPDAGYLILDFKIQNAKWNEAQPRIRLRFQLRRGSFFD